MKFELTPMFKKSKYFIQIYSKEKGDIKKVLEYIINSKSNNFSFEDFKFLKINKKKFEEIISELDMLGFVNRTQFNKLKFEVKIIKKSMKKYKKRFTKKGIRNYSKAIERRERQL